MPTKKIKKKPIRRSSPPKTKKNTFIRRSADTSAHTPLPAITQLDPDLQQQAAAGTPFSQSPRALLIGIDGNEANVSRRVGSNTYAYHLLKTLHQLPTHHKFIIYLKSEPLPDMPPATEYWQYRIMPMSRLWSQVRLPWELWTASPRPDVFFNPGHYISPFIPIPTAIALMDLAYLTHPQYFTSQDLRKLTNGTRLSISKAAHIFTISQHSKNDIIQHYQYPDSNITITYPGIDHNSFTFPQSDASINRVKRQYNTGDHYLLYVGTLQPRKNLITLIKAFCLISDLSYKLVIAGKKGWMYEDIFNHVAEQKLESRVVFTDFVPESDLPPLMAGARLVALVSLYEGFGIPVVEAAAVGTPSVVSSVSSLPEILGHAGMKVDPHNPEDIAAACNHIIGLSNKEYNQLVEKAVAHAYQFRWEHTGQQVLQALESLAQ